MDAIRILLAHPTDQGRGLLNRALTVGRPTVQVTEARNAKDFLTAVQTQHFDCVILEYQFPSAAAPELIAQAGKHLSRTPVLVVSRQRSQDVVIAAMRSGVADFIPMDQAVRGSLLWDRALLAIESSWRRRWKRSRAERRKRWLAHLAQTDPLSGLFNRHYFRSALKGGRWRGERRGLGCMIVDLDHFKRINDTYGHGTGDRLIQHAAGLLRSTIDKQDMIVRWGGEEFLILVESPDETHTWAAAERVRRAVQLHSFEALAGAIPMTCSIGFVHAPGGTFAHPTVDLADRALYLAKESGRNRVCTGSMVRARQILGDLDAAGVTDPLARRLQLLQRSWPNLGETQRHILTTHSEQVRDTAVEITHRLADPAIDIRRVELAGLFHDLGALFMPQELLASPTALNVTEWEIMALHAELGAWAGQWIGLDEEVCTLIRLHHTPYQRLRDPSSMEVHVLFAAESLAAMRSDRPYARALAREQAQNELVRESGRQFSPRVVNTILSTDLRVLSRAA